MLGRLPPALRWARRWRRDARRKSRGGSARSREIPAWCARCAGLRFCGGARARIPRRETKRCARDRRADPRMPSENSARPEMEMALESAPACEPRSAPMRRRSSSIWRLVRDAVPVRTTVAVNSARPGAAVGDAGISAAEEKLRGNFGKRAQFGEHHLHAVGKRAHRALRPGDGAFGAECGHANSRAFAKC